MYVFYIYTKMSCVQNTMLNLHTKKAC